MKHKRKRIRRKLRLFKVDKTLTSLDFKVIKLLTAMYNQRYERVLGLYNEFDRNIEDTKMYLNKLNY